MVGRAALESEKRDVIRRLVRFVDQRSGSSPYLRKTLRYLFPDHWSFLLGEVALYCFVVLLITGTYLAFFYSDSTVQVVYHGPYTPLDGQHMTAAYRSVVEISTTVKAGLLIRQTHHWAADVFVAAITLHLFRVFFTGAYRKPRELTYWIGLTILITALLEGYLGYSLVDDLLSGMGLAIGNGVALSIPFVGPSLGALVWGGPFPGGQAFFSRMYIAHVFIFPALIAVLLTVHLLLVALRHHTQFKRGPRETEKKLVGVPLFPGQTPRSLGLLLGTAAVLVLLGGLVQINPIWLWGPVPHLRVDERRTARLVSRLADRRAAARTELRHRHRPLHARPEPVLGRRAVSGRRVRVPVRVAAARVPAHRGSRVPQPGRPPARRTHADGGRRRDGHLGVPDLPRRRIGTGSSSGST